MDENYNPSEYNILIVDDLPKNLQILGKNLKDTGYNVQFATNGKIALEWLESEHFDLVLLDVMMPEMDGFEVCKKIRNESKLADLPIIFLTANSDIESTIHGFKLGAQDYVTKPFNSSELLARVKTQLELKQKSEDLKELNNLLEEKVKERTMELQIANEKLMQLDNAKSSFLNLISHEIRTPLNGILGFTGVLKNMANSEKFLNYINLLELSAKRLGDFSLNALLITSLQLNKYTLSKQKINIKSLIINILDKYKLNLNEKGIGFDINMNNDLLIEGDNELLEKCFYIIINNAYKHSSKNTKVRIDVKEDKYYKSINITDSGPGFSKNALNNLFSLFATLGTHIDQNMGIELALAKLIMDTHQAEIEVKNNDNGATVSLKFKNSV